MNNCESSDIQRKQKEEIESLRIELAKMTSLYAQMQIPKARPNH
jgi:hypothetical protein